MALEEFLESQHPEEMVSIVNPSAHDFTLEVVNPQGERVPYTVKSRESLTLPRYAAEHVARHLMEEMLSDNKGIVTEGIQNETLKRIKMYE